MICLRSLICIFCVGRGGDRGGDRVSRSGDRGAINKRGGGGGGGGGFSSRRVKCQFSLLIRSRCVGVCLWRFVCA